MPENRILEILKSHYRIEWDVQEDGRVISGWNKWIFLETPPRTKGAIIAIAELLVQRYDDRKRITITHLDIKGDFSARTQEELLVRISER